MTKFFLQLLKRATLRLSINDRRGQSPDATTCNGSWSVGRGTRNTNTTNLPTCRIAELPNCRFADLPTCRFAELPKFVPRPVSLVPFLEIGFSRSLTLPQTFVDSSGARSATHKWWILLRNAHLPREALSHRDMLLFQGRKVGH